MSLIEAENRFRLVFDKYSPKEKTSHEVLKFFAEDLSPSVKQEYIESILRRRAWILATEICNNSRIFEIKANIEVKFANILQKWVDDRLLHSTTLNVESKHPNLPKKYILDFIEITISIRNLGFPKKLLDIIQFFFENCNKNYLKKFFDSSFEVLINSFSELDIEVFFIYFSKNYIKNQYENFKDFIYGFLTEFSTSHKIFSISEKFITSLTILSKSLYQNAHKEGGSQNDLITYLLSIFIQNKGLNLNSDLYQQLINSQLENLDKGNPDNLKLFKFLKKFDFNFAAFDFESEIQSFFDNMSENIVKYNGANPILQKAIAHYYIKNSDNFVELFFFYLNNIKEKTDTFQYLQKFIMLVDTLRLSLSSLFWFKEFLSFTQVSGIVTQSVNSGYLIKIDEQLFLNKIKEYKIEQYDEEFITKNSVAFMYSRAMKNNSSMQTVSNNTKVLNTQLNFNISSLNFSASNKGQVINFVPVNEKFLNDVKRYGLKSLFTLLEVMLVEKLHSLLTVQYHYLSHPFKSLRSITRKEIGLDFSLETNDFYYLLKELRPSLYNIFEEHKNNARLFEKIKSCYEGKEVLQGTVLSRTNGGLIVEVWGINAFLPGSHVDVKFVDNFESYIGEVLDLSILKFDYNDKSIIVSRKLVIEAILENEKIEFLKTLTVGTIHEGIVKNITSYGAFVDLGTVDGLISIADISWSRVNVINDFLEINEKVTVTVLALDEATSHISLGLKQLQPNPWKKLKKEKYSIGSIITGKVIVVLEYGVLVELEEGIEGMIHVSELPKKANRSQFYVGKTVKVRIIGLNTDENKMSLSAIGVNSDSWQLLSSKFVRGGIYTGTIKNINKIGYFVELEEDVTGLVHISDLNYRKFAPAKFNNLNIQDTIEVQVLNINIQQKRISLSQKFASDEFWNLIKTFQKDEIEVIGHIKKVNYKNYEVVLENDIRALYTKTLNRNNFRFNIEDKGIFKVHSYSRENNVIFVSCVRKLRKRFN